jgi:hypothetical protein
MFWVLIASIRRCERIPGDLPPRALGLTAYDWTDSPDPRSDGTVAAGDQERAHIDHSPLLVSYSRPVTAQSPVPACILETSPGIRRSGDWAVTGAVSALCSSPPLPPPLNRPTHLQDTVLTEIPTRLAHYVHTTIVLTAY